MEGATWAQPISLGTHLRYLWYVVRHKWWVLRWGRKFGVPLWQLIVHDMSKFSRSEWGPYARYLYGEAPEGRDWPSWYAEARANHPGCASEPWWTARMLKGDFELAWQHHWQNNMHHWDYWAWGVAAPNMMPEVYVREMVADWFGAGYAMGARDIRAWYDVAKAKQRMHPETRVLVEQLLAPIC